MINQTPYHGQIKNEISLVH